MDATNNRFYRKERPIDDGGPAFPTVDRIVDSLPVGAESGMSLRDYFAGKALAAVPMPQGDLHDIPEAYDRIAQHAYKMADAMLRAREV
ncbi:hypothetical protein WK09_19955 [Burkholderia ubonensis]|uniref:hypothetical protein n=1 Tax=Burkholderia ubonensis TaxID=101571 RepID=UPI00075D74EF|nr:hypothetical protein [Burkholderia ubonensis]KVQ87315.1 hypothetical protein WK09_19955 [Burkholderia ubonensis]KWB89901.1 hypothetical protein WL43_07320 [Burkholderia ubonensis]